MVFCILSKGLQFMSRKTHERIFYAHKRVVEETWMKDKTQIYDVTCQLLRPWNVVHHNTLWFMVYRNSTFEKAGKPPGGTVTITTKLSGDVTPINKRVKWIRWPSFRLCATTSLFSGENITWFDFSAHSRLAPFRGKCLVLSLKCTGAPSWKSNNENNFNQ